MDFSIFPLFFLSFEYAIDNIDEEAEVGEDTQHHHSGTYPDDQRVSHELIINPIEVIFYVINAV